MTKEGADQGRTTQPYREEYRLLCGPEHEERSQKKIAALPSSPVRGTLWSEDEARPERWPRENLQQSACRNLGPWCDLDSRTTRTKSETENETRSAMAADLETEAHTPEEISKREPAPWRDLPQEQHQSLQDEI
jgi:hypothetical protein